MPKIDFSRAVTAEAALAAALAEAKASATSRAIAMIEAASDAITGPVPLAEQLSWTAKEDAARELLDAPEGVMPSSAAILSGEAAVTGEELRDLAGRIIANADAYRAAVSRLAGLRRLTVAAITGAESVEAVQAALQGLAGHLAAMRE